MYSDIKDITDWVNRSNVGLDPKVDACSRVLKIAEEVGEAAQAYTGFIGQNPRKGVTHTKEQLLDELADIVITALCALQYFTDDEVWTQYVVSNKIHVIRERAGLNG